MLDMFCFNSFLILHVLEQSWFIIIQVIIVIQVDISFSLLQVYK